MALTAETPTQFPTIVQQLIDVSRYDARGIAQHDAMIERAEEELAELRRNRQASIDLQAERLALLEQLGAAERNADGTYTIHENGTSD